MALVDDLLKAEKAERAKRQNAPNDQKTRDLLPVLQKHFGGCKIANGKVELMAEILSKSTQDYAILKSLKAMDTTREPIPPRWLMPGHSADIPNGPNVLLAAWYLPNGKIQLYGKNPPSVPALERECATVDDLVSAMQRHLVPRPD